MDEKRQDTPPLQVYDPSFFNRESPFLNPPSLKLDEPHDCHQHPGLQAAIMDQNLDLIDALLNTGHKINMHAFSEDPLQFREELLAFFSIAAELPGPVLAEIFRQRFCNRDFKETDFLPLHYLVLMADETLLKKIFTVLGADELILLSRYCDGDDWNFFYFLLIAIEAKKPGSATRLHFTGLARDLDAWELNPDINRLKLVLDLLCETMGRKKLSELLCYQDSSLSSDWSCMHTASIWHPECFLLTLSYLEKADYSILLEPAQGSRSDIPLFNLVEGGDTKTVSAVINLLGTACFQLTKDKDGRNILYSALTSANPGMFVFMQNVLPKDEFHDLVMMTDKKGLNLYGQLIDTPLTSLLDGNTETLSIAIGLQGPQCLKTRDWIGRTLLFHALLSRNPLMFDFVQAKLGKEDFRELLLMTDREGFNLLGQIMQVKRNGIMISIERVIALFREHDCRFAIEELCNGEQFALLLENPFVDSGEIQALFDPYTHDHEQADTYEEAGDLRDFCAIQ